MDNLTIEVGTQPDGSTFRLGPQSRVGLEKMLDRTLPATSIFIATDTNASFEHLHGSIQNHVLALLTGMSESEVESFEIEFIDPVTRAVLHTSASEH